MTCLSLNTSSCGFSLAAGLFQPPGLSSPVSSTAIQALMWLNSELAWGLDVDGEGREKKLVFQLDIFPNGFTMQLQDSLQTTKGMIERWGKAAKGR